MGLINKAIDKIKRMNNPVKYWRKKGALIGDGCEIYSTASLGSEAYLVKLGDKVRVNSGVLFITHDGGVWVLRNIKEEYKGIDIIKPIEIGNNVHIGTNAIIMPNVKIGNNCIIGCGAIVTKDIPDNSIAVGVPARVIETIEDYENKHKEEFLQTKYMSSEDKRQFLLKHFN